MAPARDEHRYRSMFNDSPEIVIQGVTAAGHTFRPSDWAERLCGMMSVFGEDRHLSYSPYLKPIMAAGLRCVVIDLRLEALDSAAFRFLLAFARDNELKLRPGRKAKRPEDEAAQPPVDAALGGAAAS
jgi:Protein of unknown function (DUF3579)